MDFLIFLQKIQQDPSLTGISTVAFQGELSPSLFFPRFFRRLKEISSSMTILNVEDKPFYESTLSLETSFLGARIIYGVKGLEELSPSQKKLWIPYLTDYKGPHCSMFFDSSKIISSSPETIVVELPSTVSPSLYKELAQFLYPQIQFDPYFSQVLFHQYQALKLDQACIMLDYHKVVGRKCEQFFKEWSPKLIVPEKSLFTLAQYFFGQQPKLFFQQWNRCVEDYPHEFWIAYWSDLVWQAAFFILSAQKRGNAEAKKTAYRLPFSFVNKDWQRYSVDSLTAAHTFLYQFEYSSKQGERSSGLELFFHAFLSNRFDYFSSIANYI